MLVNGFPKKKKFEIKKPKTKVINKATSIFSKNQSKNASIESKNDFTIPSKTGFAILYISTNTNTIATGIIISFKKRKTLLNLLVPELKF